MLYRIGQYEQALATVGPAVSTWQGGAMGQAARILERLGRLEDAVQLVSDAIDRYPDAAHLRATQAEVLWHAGRHTDAARALVVAQPFLSQVDWRETIAEGFADAFATKPAEQAKAAFAALVAAQLPVSLLSQLVQGIDLTHRMSDEVLFRVHSQLRPGREHGSYVLSLRSYSYLRRWKGEAAARQWLADATPKRDRGTIADVVYREGDEALLWEVAEASGSGDVADFTWLMRAAAFVRGGRSSPYGRQLREHYENSRGNGPYAVMGRYLMGLSDEQAVFRLMGTPQRRCEASYYLGLRAWGDRRYAEAIAWFRAAVETGERQNGEFYYAKDALLRIQNADRSLDVLARGGREPVRFGIY